VLIIDGSYGEGGGQILRTSLTLSAILKRPVKITNIRSGRKNPGLQPQHLTAARAVAHICGGNLIGGNVGSQSIEFHPGPVVPGNYTFDVSEIKPSAGSVNLIFQTVLLPLTFAGKESRVTIKGGTHVPWSPAANYISDVYLPILAIMGLLVWYKVKKSGYYPIGGGEIRADIRPVTGLKPINLTERSSAGTVTCYSAVSNLPRSIVDRQMSVVVSRLRPLGIEPIQVIEEYDSPGKGTVTFILFDDGVIKAGFTSLGERGKPAEKVAADACDEFEAWWKSGMALDKHLADQLIVPMAFASGESAFTTEEITLHLSTNIWTVEHFLHTEINVEGKQGEPGTIRVSGSV